MIMWIRNGSRVVNTDNLDDIHVFEDYINMGINGFNTPLIQYSTCEYAEKAFNKLVIALKSGKKTVFTMPTEEELKEDSSVHIKTAEPCMSMEEAINLWNTLADDGYKQISRVPIVGSGRWQMLNARLIQYTKDEWEKCIDNIHKSELLKKNQDGWFNFDWFIRPSNFPKVLDGNYNNANDRVDEDERGWWDE